MTVTARYYGDEAPGGISYDQSAASASLGTGDQTNRLPIALPIIGAIDTPPLLPTSATGDRTIRLEEGEFWNVTQDAPPSPGLSPVPQPCY